MKRQRVLCLLLALSLALGLAVTAQAAERRAADFPDFDSRAWYAEAMTAAVEDGLLRLYFHGAAEGRKYELLRRNPQVAFACDCGHRLVTDAARGYCTMEYESVIGRGRLELVPESEKEHGLSVLMAHYDRTLEWSRAAVARTCVMRLTVTAMTGKRLVAEKPRQNG